MEISSFNISLREYPDILISLKSFLYANNYVVQEFKKGNGFILQIKNGGTFKTLLGLATATNINVDDYETYFTISFSGGKWADKAVVAGVSIFILWPLLITLAVGAYKQAELPNKVINFLNREVG